MLPFLRSDLAQLTAYSSHTIPTPADPTAMAAVAQTDRLDTNESPEDLPAEFKQKLGWAVQDLIEANRYPDGAYDDLKQAIATYVTESAGLPTGAIAAPHITVGNGSDELIRSVLIATCLNGAGSILVADPTFSMYGILAQTLGIPVQRVGRSPDTFAIDLAAAQAAVNSTTTPPVRVVFVVHPNSPTANALTDAEIAWLRSLPEHILVVVDEAYFEFSQTTLVADIQQRPNWLVFRTFSKAFRLAAYRVGYAIAQPDLIAVLEKVRLPYNLPAVAQTAAHLAIAQRHNLLANIPQILHERQRLIDHLRYQPALTVWDSQANFVYATLTRDRGTPSEQRQHALARIHQQLKQQGTLIRQIADGFRITVGTPDENTRTLERLTALLADEIC